jgi:hypothetical protein
MSHELKDWLPIEANNLPGAGHQIEDQTLLRRVRDTVGISKKRRRRRILGIFLAGVITVGAPVAAYFSKNQIGRGHSAIGATCWLGSSTESNVVQIGATLTPMSDCKSLLDRLSISRQSVSGCVDVAGVINVVPDIDSCASLHMESLDSTFPYEGDELIRVQSVLSSVVLGKSCVESATSLLEIESRLRNSDLRAWTLVPSQDSRAHACARFVVNRIGRKIYQVMAES